MRMIALGILALSALSNPLTAQRLTDSRVAAAVHARDTVPVRIAVRSEPYNADVQSVKMIFTGVMTGAAGALAGGAIGYGMASCSSDEWFCGLGEMLIGGFIGEVVALPAGVHMNGQHSSLGSKMGTSVVVGVIAAATAPVTQGASILAMPVVQLIAIIAREHRAAERSLGNGTR